MNERSRENTTFYTKTGRIGDLMLSVVIPALNEEAGIAGIVEKVLATEESLRKIGINGLEVLVVDDGSRDATAEKVEQTSRVRLIRHTVNRGYGAAIKTGFGQARGELLAFLDADSTYPPECLAELCETALREDADVVVGSRRGGADSKMPPVRRLGNLIWSTLLSHLGSERVQDPASGMRVLRRRCLQQLYPLPNGLNFTPVMSTRALHEGLKVVEVPIAYRERSGRSKLSVVRDGIRFLTTILWTALQYNPARVLELGGFAAFLGSGLIGVLLVAVRLSGVTTLGLWGVFSVHASLVLAVGGVSIFSLGIVFNRLVMLLHRRPIRQSNMLASVLGPSPERHFGWIGLLLGTAGAILGSLTLILGLNGWDLPRLWLWLLGSALFVLVGLQLALFWTLIRVLDTLLERDDRTAKDLLGADLRGPAIPATLGSAVSEPRLN
jgi:glycosyltransferase involved in cell wall biosynthesis